MIKWFHKLLNPHCVDCHAELEESRICQSCETLRAELAEVRFQNKQLMNSILEIVHPKPAEVTEKREVEFKPLTTSWRVKRQMLEENDRLTAQALKAKQAEVYESSKSTEDLEKELLGT